MLQFITTAFHLFTLYGFPQVLATGLPRLTQLMLDDDIGTIAAAHHAFEPRILEDRRLDSTFILRPWRVKGEPCMRVIATAPAPGRGRGGDLLAPWAVLPEVKSMCWVVLLLCGSAGVLVLGLVVLLCSTALLWSFCPVLMAI